MNKLAEYETPLTDAVYPPEIITREVVKQKRKWGWGTLHDMRERSCDLERKLAICRDALGQIVALGEVMPEPTDETEIAIEALEATK